MRRAVLPILLGLGLAACGSEGIAPTDQRARQCAAETRAATYAPGMSERSSGGLEVRLVENLVGDQPGAPDRGMNTLRLEVLDEAGVVHTDLPLRMKAWMPDHGHGTTPLFHDGEVDGEVIEVGPFDLHMAGFWELTVLVERAGAEDPVVFAFCVEG
ncbi:MAG: hypothetical protein KC933_17355 [Myxococcales bacterium]|nr:hypothetical protein [Myxococcales bacterium]